jgi:hypothetical protein
MVLALFLLIENNSNIGEWMARTRGQVLSNLERLM